MSDSIVEGGEADGIDDEGVDDGSKLTETVAAELNAVGAEDAKGDPSTIAASEVEAGDPEADGRAVEVAENAVAENMGGEGLGTDAPADTNQPGTSDAAPEDQASRSLRLPMVIPRERILLKNWEPVGKIPRT